MSYAQASDFRKVCPQCNKTFQDQDAPDILTECPDDGATLVFDTIDPIVGTRLADRFQIEEMIGRGATSTVYHAFDLKAEPGQNGKSGTASKSAAAHASPVAIKVLHPHLSSDAAVVKRLSQEAKSLREFSHKNVVNMITLGVTRQGQPFLVMELVEGQSLLEYLRQNGALSNQLCLAIFDQIFDAIGAAHNRGILHRDLKPGNIMLTPDGNGGFCVKLLDFGIAKVVPLQGDTFFRLTQTGEMMGSLLYMSPEQCLEQDWDQRGDIYSLGCVLYEALTARAPLIGRTAFETMNKHLTEMPPPLSVVRPDIEFARGIEQVVMKMLEKDPLARYQTAEDVRAHLRLVADGKGAALESPANRKSKFSGFKIKALTKDPTVAKSPALAANSSTHGDMLAAQMKDNSRQRMFEVGIFLVLMVIWAIPLLFAFSSTPNALIAACLFGVLLPFLAAVSAMVVVRLSRFSGVSKLHPLLFFSPKNINMRRLISRGVPGSMNLGVEAKFLTKGFFFEQAARKTIETYQRAQSMPFLLLGNQFSGKTRLMATLVTGDLEDARKLQVVLSPDGKLADLVVSWIASHPQGETIARRVLFIDMSNKKTEIHAGGGNGDSALKYISEHMNTFMSLKDPGHGYGSSSMREEARALIRECINKRKALIIKGSNEQECPQFFRMVLNEILKESRPSSRLSDAENNPVVYIDDADVCGVFDNCAHAFAAPSETGVEFIVATDSIAKLARSEPVNMVSRFGGLAVFSVLERDALELTPFYDAQWNKQRTHGSLESVEREFKFFGDEVPTKLSLDFSVKTLSNQPQRSFFYLSKTSNDRPVRLLAPFFPEIRITEVEWSIVESMRTGWKLHW
jgi:serine/threonine protein kinase